MRDEIRCDRRDISADELEPLAEHNLKLIGLKPLRLVLPVSAGAGMPHHISADVLVDAVPFDEAAAQGSDRVDIGTFAEPIARDVHPFAKPVDQIAPCHIVELSPAALGLVEVEFGEERGMPLCFDGPLIGDQSEA